MSLFSAAKCIVLSLSFGFFGSRICDWEYGSCTVLQVAASAWQSETLPGLGSRNSRQLRRYMRLERILYFEGQCFDAVSVQVGHDSLSAMPLAPYVPRGPSTLANLCTVLFRQHCSLGVSRWEVHYFGKSQISTKQLYFEHHFSSAYTVTFCPILLSLLMNKLSGSTFHSKLLEDGTNF